MVYIPTNQDYIDPDNCFEEDERNNKMEEIEEMVEISVEEYNDLIDDSIMLMALNAAGVDNWQGYDDAIEIYNEMSEEE